MHINTTTSHRAERTSPASWPFYMKQMHIVSWKRAQGPVGADAHMPAGWRRHDRSEQAVAQLGHSTPT
eukprot:2058695-Alexandrium_andersonii.AAC.1